MLLYQADQYRSNISTISLQTYKSTAFDDRFANQIGHNQGTELLDMLKQASVIARPILRLTQSLKRQSGQKRAIFAHFLLNSRDY